MQQAIIVVLFNFMGGSVMTKRFFLFTFSIVLFLGNGLFGMEDASENQIISLNGRPDLLVSEIMNLLGVQDKSRLIHKIVELATKNEDLGFLTVDGEVVESLIKQLFEYDFNFNQLDENNKTPLDCAIANGDNDLIETLKNLGGKETYHVKGRKLKELLEALSNVEGVKHKLLCIDLGGGYSRNITKDDIVSLSQYDVGSLNLRHNNLKSLPCEFVNLSKLQKLNLNRNWELSREALETVFSMKSLEKLDIGSCSITLLPGFCKNLTKLRELCLDYNKLSKRSIRAVCEIASLEKLDLSCTNLRNLSSELKK